MLEVDFNHSDAELREILGQARVIAMVGEAGRDHKTVLSSLKISYMEQNREPGKTAENVRGVAPNSGDDPNHCCRRAIG